MLRTATNTFSVVVKLDCFSRDNSRPGHVPENLPVENFKELLVQNCFFYRSDPLNVAHPTVSEHWKNTALLY